MSESLFARGLRTLGPARLRDQLAAVRLSSFVPEASEDFASLSALDVVDHLWELQARPEQLPPPGEHDVWVIMAGRGFGKTRAGAQATVAAAQDAARWVAQGILAPEEARLHVIAATAADARDTVVEGPGGLLRCSPPWFPAEYEPSKRRVVWPGGVQALLFSAEEGERLRGPQATFLWCDELCAWRFPDDTWSNAQFGLRLGPRPRTVITSTPRPSRLLREILAQPGTVVTRGSTRDNVANLAPSAVERLYREYGNTRLGRQELEGEMLTDNPAALWKLSDIDRARLTRAPELRRVVVAVDPAVTSREDSDETGVIVAGVAPCACKGTDEQHAFVIEDASGTYTPDAWACVVARAHERHRADRVVAEVNNGGDLVESNLRTLGGAHLPFTKVHASRGKMIRAEPVAAFYEQGKVHHVGSFSKLEDQLTQWNPMQDAKSPDRLDALVWALSHLMLVSPVARYEPPPRGMHRGRRI